MSDQQGKRRVVARNRRAFHDFEIFETLEAGLVLTGSEVKSLREGKASIAEAYAAFTRGELFLVDMHIPEYSFAHYAGHEPGRRRKLLLHRRELKHLDQSVTRRGLTLVALQLYFAGGRAKVELGLARGRKRHDKRDSLRRAEAQRDIRRAEGRR